MCIASAASPTARPHEPASQVGQWRRLISPTDRAEALALTPVSRETAARLDRFVDAPAGMAAAHQSDRALDRADRSGPAISPIRCSSSRWRRQARIWVDLGSGGGFPGLVIACALADTPGAQVHLVESNAQESGVPARSGRGHRRAGCGSCRTDRGFRQTRAASRSTSSRRARWRRLPNLLAAAYPLLKTGAMGLFPKGQDVEAELTEAAKCWNIRATLVPSRTDPRSRIVVVDGIEPRH